MINVVIVGSYDLERRGIENSFQPESGIKVLARTFDEQEALHLLAEGSQMQIILYSVNSTLTDFSFISDIKVINPYTRVMLLATDNTPENVKRAFQSGARAYMLKSVGMAELIFAIKHVFNGHLFLSAELGLQMLPQEAAEGSGLQNNIFFSAQDRKILKLLSQGLNTKELSGRLNLNLRTVEGYRKKLYQKTAVKNTAGLIRYAILHGVID
jgi:DNA-binding NarL/FixJ family response regulator